MMKKQKEKQLNTEKVPLFVVYRENGKLRNKKTKDCNDLELFAYLKLVLNVAEERFYDDIV